MKVTNQECKSVFKAKETTMKCYEKWVKFISYVPCVALIGSLLIGPPQSLAQDAESSSSEPVRLTVAPHTSSRIAMKTLPKALCVLHADGDSDPSRSLKMFSDDEGMIRFNVNPSEESDEVAAFAVDCTSDAQSGTFGLELRPSHIPSLDMPAPAAEIRTPKSSDVIRPALTKADALQLSDDELVKREYPVRPNSKEAPDAFAAWLEAVTHPARRVDARQVAHPEMRASQFETETDHAWSGIDLKNAPNEIPVSTYDLVEGEWYVPTVYPQHQTTASSVFWIGLDGDNGVCPNYCPGHGNNSDLWQAGTGQTVQEITYFGLHIFFSTYNAWTEFLPSQPTMQVLPNFNVSPGDLIYSDVWVGNRGQGTASLSGLYAIAYIEDLTTGHYTNVYNCRGLSVTILGAEVCTSLDQVNIIGYQAEWIMERPSFSGVLPNLADYNTAQMFFPYAMQTNGSLLNYYNAANSQEIFMYGTTGNLLSAVNPANSSTIVYYWGNLN